MMRKKLLVLSALAIMSMTVVGCGSKAPVYVDGNYEGTGQGLYSEITVSVGVKDGKIASVEILDQEETPEVAGEALVEIPKRIVEKNSAEVDVVTGATGTSDGIMEAVSKALEGKTE